jgi:hypothetical protein
MNYSGMEFSRLVEEVEGQGGTHLDLLHERRKLVIPKQADVDGARASTDLKTCGCDDATLFSLPYERLTFGGEPDTDQQINIGKTERCYEDGVLKRKSIPAHMAVPVDEEDESLVVCAIDDAVGAWPRFAGAWEDDDE